MSNWKRLGSEAQAADAKGGHVSPIADDELRQVLAHHFSDDLPLDENEASEALDSLVDGYRHGG